MVGDSKRSGEIDELLRAADVDSSIQIEDAQDNAIRAELLGHEYIALHDLEFIIRIAEIAAARPNHNVKADGNRLAHGGNQPRAGSDASVEKTAAKFNTMSSTALRSKSRLDRIDTHFEGQGLVHKTSLVCGIDHARIPGKTNIVGGQCPPAREAEEIR